MSTSIPLSERITRLSNHLESGLYERQHAVRLCLLAALCGESVFLLGPPGIAKSLIARRLKYAFKQAKSFEYLMTRFSTPEEVFGPLSIKALKEEGRYVRITRNYLPEAEIVFLDEIWKAGPAILNTLLTAINERRFRNGDMESAIPLKLLIAASNELPEEDSGLEALYDRMLIRISLTNVQEKHHFLMLINQRNEENVNSAVEALGIDGEEYEQWQDKINQVAIPEEVFELVYRLRQEISELDNGPYISDRRWKKAARLLQASAFFNDRAAISIVDIILLKDCLWYDERSQSLVDHQLEGLMTEIAYQQQAMLMQIRQIDKDWMKFQQQQSKQQSLTVETKNAMFSRKPIYLLNLPADASEVTLTLETPLTLHEIDVTHVVIEKQRLEQWLAKGEYLKGKLNGIGFMQSLDMAVNDAQQLVLQDAGLSTSTLYLSNNSDHIKPSEALTQRLQQVQNRLDEQRKRFNDAQPCLFVDKSWLAKIEASLLAVHEEIEKQKQRFHSSGSTR